MRNEVMLFDFYGIRVSVSSNSPEITERLEKDFSYFKAAPSARPADCAISATLGPVPWEKIPPQLHGLKNRNCLSFQHQRLRYNDYDRQALSIYDFKQEKGHIFSAHLQRLHEVTYLLILSRAGKALEKKGLHRIHSMGISLHGKTLLCLMPMKGGKTTLFLHLLQDPETRIISDDSPLVTKEGNILPFPLRIGLEPEAEPLYRSRPDLDFSQHTVLERRIYGKKILLPLSALPRPVFEGKPEPLFLFVGKRMNQPGCRIKQSHGLGIAPALFMNLVIGMGLPLMREYFIEGSFHDTGTLLRILFSRLRAAWMLLKHSGKHKVFLGTDHKTNADTIIRWISGRTQSQNPAHKRC